MGGIEIPRRSDAIRDHKQTGGGVAAVFPIHYPRALLRSFDLLPVEVWGPPGTDTTAGDEHLQAYTCSIVRCSMAFLLSGGLEVADLIVVPHACDSLQGLGSLLIDFLPPTQPLQPLYLPRGAGEPALRYLTGEIAAMFDRLAEITSKQPTNADLMAAIEREERADALLAKLLQERGQLSLSDRELYQVARAREYLPAESFVELAERALELRASEPRSGTAVILSGLVPEPMAILDVITDAGGKVVADDLACCGRRLYPAGTSEEPFRRIAEGMLGAAPDSTLGCSVGARIEHLRRLAANTNASAVIFHVVKFCEPELFYLPQLRQALEQQGVRSLVIELDVSDAMPHQIVTRIEALLETTP